MISENPDAALAKNARMAAYLAVASSPVNTDPITRASANAIVDQLFMSGSPVATAAISLRDGVLNTGHSGQPDYREVLKDMHLVSNSSLFQGESAHLTFLAGNQFENFMKIMAPERNADVVSLKVAGFQDAVKDHFGMDYRVLRADQHAIDSRDEDHANYGLDGAPLHAAMQLEIINDTLAHLPEDKTWIAGNLKTPTMLAEGLLMSYEKNRKWQGFPENPAIKKLLESTSGINAHQAREGEQQRSIGDAPGAKSWDELAGRGAAIGSMWALSPGGFQENREIHGIAQKPDAMKTVENTAVPAKLSLAAMGEAYARASESPDITSSPVQKFTSGKRSKDLLDSADAFPSASEKPSMSVFQKLSERLSNSLDNLGVQLMNAGGMATQTITQHVRNIVESVKESFGQDLSPSVSDFMKRHGESSEDRPTASQVDDSAMRPE